MYKGELEGFPREIVERMLECQIEQDNPRDISVFEDDRCAGRSHKGFTWGDTLEGHDFWARILIYGKLDAFFIKYPKTSPYPKVMMVGDSYPLTLKRVVFMKKCGKFIAWEYAETLEDAETVLNTSTWEYAEDIKPENPQKQELLAKAEELIQKAEELKAAANKL